MFCLVAYGHKKRASDDAPIIFLFSRKLINQQQNSFIYYVSHRRDSFLMIFYLCFKNSFLSLFESVYET